MGAVADLAVASSGDGVPVVFVHGSNGGLDSWGSIGDQLAGHRIVRYARRNHLPSPQGPSPNSFAFEAEDLLAVIDAVTDEASTRAHVVGGSYGATVALHAALANASRIASLALFEPPLLLSGKHLQPTVQEFQRLCDANRFDDAHNLFLRDVARIPADVLAAATSSSRDRAAAEARAALGDLEAMAGDGDDVARWSGIEVPVLLMQGGRSWVPLPEGMDRLAAVLPDVRRVVWDDQSHFATAAAPSRVAAAIRAFIATC